MSDQINSLIHTNAVMAFQQGEKTEQHRIIKLLEGLAHIDEAGHEMIGEFKSDLIALIKEEQK